MQHVVHGSCHIAVAWVHLCKVPCHATRDSGTRSRLSMDAWAAAHAGWCLQEVAPCALFLGTWGCVACVAPSRCSVELP